MGRRSLPERRFSLRGALRFGPVEAAIAVGALALTVVFGLLSARAAGTATELVREGRCVEAQVTRAGAEGSLRLGRSARISYVVDNRRYDATLRYDGDGRLRTGSSVQICVGSDDPATFAVDSAPLTGESTNLWLRRLVGNIVSGLGGVGLLVVLSTHQWRFHDEDLEDES